MKAFGFSVSRLGVRGLDFHCDKGVYFFCILVWFAGSVYSGLWHDAKLYALQAYAILNPEAYSNDLFYFENSQNSFTVFPYFYSQLIRLFGLTFSSWFGYFFGNLFWILSLTFLLENFFPKKMVFLVVCIVALSSNYYGGVKIFSYGEGFFTARIFSEALVFLSIKYLLDDRIGVVSFFVGFAIILHPIIGFSAGIFIFFHFFLNSQIKWRVVLPCFLLIILSILLVDWFFLNFLWLEMDEVWFNVVKERSGYLFVSQWGGGDLAWVLISIVSLFVGSQSQSRNRGVYLSLLVVTSLILVGYFVFSEFFHNKLVVQSQLWRILFLAKIFAFIAFIDVVVYSDFDGNKYNLYGLFFPIWLATFIDSNAIVWVCLVSPALYVFLVRNRISRGFFLGSSGIVVFFNSTCILWGFYLDWMVYVSVGLGFYSDFIGLIMIFMVVLSYFFYIEQKKINRVARFLMLSFMILGLSRNVYSQVVASLNIQGLFSSNLASVSALESLEGGNVFWPGHLFETWYVFNRPYYFSEAQGAAVVFSRELAVEWKRRHELFESLQKAAEQGSVSQGYWHELCQLEEPDAIIYKNREAVGPLSFEYNGQRYQVKKCKS